MPAVPVVPVVDAAVDPPRSADVGLFTAGGASEGDPHLSSSPDSQPYDDEPEPRRGRTGLYAGVGAVAVVAVAVLATMVLSPDKPQRDQALPDAATGAVVAPSGSATEPPTALSSSRSTPTSPTGSAPTPSSASASAPDEASPSSSPSRTTSDKPRPTRPPSRSTSRATGSMEPAPPSTDAMVLSRGDRGPEVKELQQRLHQLYLYMGKADGTYDDPVADAVTRFQSARGTQGDGTGVYGEETRAALEAETSEPR